MRLLGCISSGTYAWGAVQSSYFQTGVVGQYDLSRNVQTIALGLFSGILLEGHTVLSDRGQGSETWDRRHLNRKRRRRSGEVAKLSRI
jgi:hypothetical protein